MLRRYVHFGLVIIFLMSLLAGCFFSPPPPTSTDVYGVISLTQPDDVGGYSKVIYACAGDSVLLRYKLVGIERATLSATPADALSPALPETQVTGEQTLMFEVLRGAILTLDYRISTRYTGISEEQLELIPADICTGFPSTPLGSFTGTLMQETPAPQTLDRTFKLYWRESGLKALLSADDRYEISLDCSVNSANNTLNCANTGLTLNINVEADGLTGSYKGSTEGSVSSGTFSGTFDFRAP